MTEEIREIIDSAKARGLYQQMQDAAKEYVEVPNEERRERCYLIHGRQHDILEGVIELEGLKPHKAADTLWALSGVPSPKTAPENATVNATATAKLSKTQRRILPILQSNKFATYEEIAKQLDIERTTVWRNLDSLKKKNVIKRIGGDKDGHWEVLISIEDYNK